MNEDTFFSVVFPILFVVAFAGFWTMLTFLFRAMSGWPGLEDRFPDQDDEALVTIRGASGVLGGHVRMKGALKLVACRNGLRVAMSRLFAPFSKPVYVPWEQIQVVRSKGVFTDFAELVFGAPQVGRLKITAGLAARLSKANPGRWPEAGAPQRNAPIVS
jgi:hypothetical protein